MASRACTVVVQVTDAVVIVNAAVGFHLIFGAQTVFHDKQRLLVAIPQHVQQRAQAQRVYLPAPLRARQCGFGTMLRILPRACWFSASSAVTQPVM